MMVGKIAYFNSFLRQFSIKQNPMCRRATVILCVTVISVTFSLIFFDFTKFFPMLCCLSQLVLCRCVTSPCVCVCWQVMHLEDYEDGATLSNLNHGPYPLFISLILLVLDSIFYLLVAVYLDQVIPGMFMRRIKLNCANITSSRSPEGDMTGGTSD